MNGIQGVATDGIAKETSGKLPQSQKNDAAAGGITTKENSKRTLEGEVCKVLSFILFPVK